MKNILLGVLSVFFCAGVIHAQQREHRIVFDFTEGDTASFATVVRHAKAIMDLTGNARLEIVCHGPGLDMLVKNKTTVQKEIAELNKLNVVFAACEATMKRRGVDRSQLIPQAITVPIAILEISSKEQDGWSYVKESH